MFYADSDGQGNIIGFYSDEFNYPNGIPASAIPITNEQWQECICNPGKYIVQDGQLVLTPDIILLPHVKEAKIAQIYAAREAKIQAGFTSNASGTVHTYSFNEIDEVRINGQLNILNADPTVATIQWLTLDAGIIDHTRDQFIQVCKDAFAFRHDRTLKDYSLRAQVEAAATIDEVNAIAW